MTCSHKPSWFLAVLCAFAAAVPALAHHSFAAEFDAKKCSEITGVLTSVDWQNPHAYIYVDVKSAAGAAESVTFQLSSISNLRRGGMERKNTWGEWVSAKENAPALLVLPARVAELQSLLRRIERLLVRRFKALGVGP